MKEVIWHADERALQYFQKLSCTLLVSVPLVNLPKSCRPLALNKTPNFKTYSIRRNFISIRSSDLTVYLHIELVSEIQSRERYVEMRVDRTKAVHLWLDPSGKMVKPNVSSFRQKCLSSYWMDSFVVGIQRLNHAALDWMAHILIWSFTLSQISFKAWFLGACQLCPYLTVIRKPLLHKVKHISWTLFMKHSFEPVVKF